MSGNQPADPIPIAQALIRCPSVTPADAGAIAVVEDAAAAMGFACRRLEFAAPGTVPIANLYARRGTGGRNFCIAGHTDVVPAGDEALRSVPPYSVVVPGTLPGKPLSAGGAGPSLACAVIVKRVDAQTRAKTSINDLLRA